MLRAEHFLKAIGYTGYNLSIYTVKPELMTTSLQ
jgi:hypothetical protein